MSCKSFSKPKPHPPPKRSPNSATKGKDADKDKDKDKGKEGVATLKEFVVEKVSSAVSENIPDQIRELSEPYRTRCGFLAVIGLITFFLVFFFLQFQSGIKTKFIALHNDAGLCTNVSKGKKKLEFYLQSLIHKKERISLFSFKYINIDNIKLIFIYFFLYLLNIICQRCH